jgi:prepilin-type N-terminal cleavage/methylation domain-containing protein
MTTTTPTAAVRQDGYSLLEMMLVIGLLAALAAFAVPAMSGSTRAAGDALARANADAATTAVIAARRDAGVFEQVAGSSLSTGEIAALGRYDAYATVDLTLVGPDASAALGASVHVLPSSSTSLGRVITAAESSGRCWFAARGFGSTMASTDAVYAYAPTTGAGSVPCTARTFVHVISGTNGRPALTLPADGAGRSWTHPLPVTATSP